MIHYRLHLKHILCWGIGLILIPSAGFSREFSIVTYNLEQFSIRKKGLKTETECRAIAQVIAQANPDILAVQEIGAPPILEAFQGWLKTEGLDYPYVEFLQRGDRPLNLAILSRFPILQTTHHTNEWYSIGKAKLTVGRGFLETQIQVEENYTFRLINAHLKSKVYSRLGQTEMRRNEARLLNKVARGILKAHPNENLLVVGDMNDNPNSAAIREVKGKPKKILIDLRPTEPSGDAWTYYMEKTGQHMRIDYFFANEKLAKDLVPEKSTVIRTPLTYTASDHRPIKAVFQTTPSTATP